MIQEVPYEKWPKFAKIACKYRDPGEVGVGQTIERGIALTGAHILAAALKSVGVPCGCTARKEELNLKYPYKKDISSDAPNCYIHPE